MALLLIFGTAPAPAQSLAPSGTESALSGALRGDQLFPALSIGPAGGLIVWQDNTIDGTNGTGIAARWLDANLNPLSTPFRVNDTVAGNQRAPQVVGLLGGNSLVVWESRVGAKQTVNARVLGTNGTFLTRDLKISPESSSNIVHYRTNWYVYTNSRYRKRGFRLKDVILNIREQSGQATAAALPDGNALIVYQSVRRQETNSWGLSRTWRWNGVRSLTNDVLVPTRVFVDWMQDVYFQRLSPTGQKLGPEVQANQLAEYNQRSPAVAVLANGNFVVVWVSERARSYIQTDNFGVEIYGRVFNSQGEALGDDFLVSGPENLVPANPAVAALGAGGFVVTWSQQESALSRNWDVVSRAFNSDGTPAGAVQLVNTYTTGDQFAPRMAAVADYHLVVWTSTGQDGSREGIYGRLLSSGAPASDEFRVNTTTISRQIQPAVAADPHGRFLAAWASYTGENSFDLFGQGYTVSLPIIPPAGGAQVVNQTYGTVGAGVEIEAIRVNQGIVGVPPLPRGPLNVFGPAVAPPALPESTSAPLQVGLSGPLEKLHLNWNTVTGARYQVEVSTDFKSWTPVGEARTAAGATDSVAVDITQPSAFYRVILLR